MMVSTGYLLTSCIISCNAPQLQIGFACPSRYLIRSPLIGFMKKKRISGVTKYYISCIGVQYLLFITLCLCVIIHFQYDLLKTYLSFCDK